MLVLTRKSNQSIMIGDDIEVSVLSIMGEKVRIGIQAPRDIPVFRKEVYLEIQEERGGVGVSVGDPRRSTRSGGDDEASSLRAEVDNELRKLGGS
jgi:carbon storage regulator